MKTFTVFYRSPLGALEIVSTDTGIVSLSFVEEEANNDRGIPDCLKNCLLQIEEYFKGDRKAFCLPLTPRGTEFQQRVWQALEQIPYGEVVSYGDIARAIGKPGAARAVGGANNKNPIAIIIPCHRVIGQDGSLTGYGSGVWRKEWLLSHEKGAPRMADDRAPGSPAFEGV